MSKHTPGPWETVETQDGGWWVATGDEHRGYRPHARADEQADARLMAASPELLEACKVFASWLAAEDEGPHYGPLGRDGNPEGERIFREWFNRNLRLCKDAQEKALAAIAKAEGRA